MSIEYIHNLVELEGNSSVKKEKCIGGQLKRLFQEAKEKIFIVSPFITEDITINDDYKTDCKEINVLTRSPVSYTRDYVVGASKIDVLLNMADRSDINIRYCDNLHAKIYLFDSKKAVMTSANLTKSGLKRNIEYGVILDVQEIDSVVKFVNTLWSYNKDNILSKEELIRIKGEIEREYKPVFDRFEKEKEALVKSSVLSRVQGVEYLENLLRLMIGRKEKLNQNVIARLGNTGNDIRNNCQLELENGEKETCIGKSKKNGNFKRNEERDSYNEENLYPQRFSINELRAEVERKKKEI